FTAASCALFWTPLYVTMTIDAKIATTTMTIRSSAIVKPRAGRYLEMLADMRKAKLPGRVSFLLGVENCLRVVQRFDFLHIPKHVRAVHLLQPRPTDQAVVVFA